MATANPGHTVDAGVRMSAHAFAATVKVGIYECVSACNKKVIQNKNDKSKNEKSKGFFMTPPTE